MAGVRYLDREHNTTKRVGRFLKCGGTKRVARRSIDESGFAFYMQKNVVMNLVDIYL